MISRKIQAVTFDAAGTLIHLAEPVGRIYQSIAERHGIEADADALEAAFRAVWKRTPQPFSNHSEFVHEDEKDWWKRVVFDVFAEAGAIALPDSRFEAFFNDLYDHFEAPGTWLAHPQARPVVECVARHFPCAVLSNFDARLRSILAHLELLEFFDHTFLSCELKSAKPSPDIFAIAAATLQFPPSQILHVGDDPLCDWAGAVEAGFRSFRIGPKEHDLPELLNELSLAR